eukprot:CAMPEP_0206569296 /NCGR_PEP_ID=MMETSP0325_2-20121206/26354_1 /ASSEMBLY_ACC=CAM_ASM_000347 /TAXON_ID=2866 /ORGANISM="Crypthecodinium cohnii, Strain Seligo" /LENGTH=593 /DNA_ID=CAMNT_0054072859 /DNA_START=288 /DNA_END=2069 /DNA_ORIENTATION=-
MCHPQLQQMEQPQQLQHSKHSKQQQQQQHYPHHQQQQQQQQLQLQKQQYQHNQMQDSYGRAPKNQGQTERKATAGKAKSGRFGSATWEHTQLNRSICEVADRGDAEGLLVLVHAKQSRMSLVNLSTALHRLARMASEDGHSSWDKADHRFKALNNRITTKMSEVTESTATEDYVRCLSTLSWAYGRLQHYDESLMEMISGLAIRNLSQFKSFELINLLWGFAKLQLNKPQLFQAAQEHILANVSNFSSRCLSMAAWSYATMRVQHGCVRLLKRVAEAFVQNLDVLQEKPVSLANLSWALATSGVHPKQDIVRKLGDASVQMLADFKANELSITLWAFARMSCFHVPFFAAALDRLGAEPKLQADIHPQGITNILFAYARLAEANAVEDQSRLALGFKGLIPTCASLFPLLSGTEISSILASLTKLESCWGMLTTSVRDALANLVVKEGAAYISVETPTCLCGCGCQPHNFSAGEPAFLKVPNTYPPLLSPLGSHTSGVTVSCADGTSANSLFELADEAAYLTETIAVESPQLDKAKGGWSNCSDNCSSGSSSSRSTAAPVSMDSSHSTAAATTGSGSPGDSHSRGCSSNSSED